MPALKAAYKVAVRNGREAFTFHGEKTGGGALLYTRYAHYLIEHLECLKK